MMLIGIKAKWQRCGEEQQHLLDVSVDADGVGEQEEHVQIVGHVAEVEERLGKLNVLKGEGSLSRI